MKKLRLLLLIFFTVVLSGCAIRFDTAKETETSGFNAVMKVKCNIQKSDSLCGWAASETIADYYGKTLNAGYEEKLSKEAGLTGGIAAGNLKALFEASNFDVAVYPGKFDMSFQGIFKQLESKRPVIILLCDKPDSIGHYVVIYGYDGNRGLLAVMDPAKCSYILPINDISTAWSNAKFLTILALPKQ
jgi:ABC-type bacteriocin/lantibiotic exporter with double-glycine peptidase domain